MSIDPKLTPPTQSDLGDLWQAAESVAMLQAITTGAVRYLARASEHIITEDLSCALDLVSRALESDETIDKLTDDLRDMMMQERGGQ